MWRCVEHEVSSTVSYITKMTCLTRVSPQYHVGGTCFSGRWIWRDLKSGGDCLGRSGPPLRTVRDSSFARTGVVTDSA